MLRDHLTRPRFGLDRAPHYHSTMPENLIDDLPELLDAVNDSMIKLRHDLHAHPELAFQEFRTTKVITDRLASLDFEIRPCPTKTGAVARLVGARPGRRVMVRADIDGLPISEERSDLAYLVAESKASCTPAATTCTPRVSSALPTFWRGDATELEGEFTLLFQPAEEVIGGARSP